MRRFFASVVAVVAVATPTVPVLLTGTAGAATAAPSTDASAAPAARAGSAHRLPVTRNKPGVEPGFSTERITAKPGDRARGRVRFVLKGEGISLVRKVRIKRGRAVFRVPPLGTGDYRVRAGFRGRHGAASFRVYESAVRLDTTSFTVSKSSFDTQYAAQLTGDVVFADGRPSDGYLDVYLNGDASGGRGSAPYLGFTGVATNGTFDFTRFGQDVANAYPPGTYTFQAFYTPTPSFAYYVASNYVTVVVTA